MSRSFKIILLIIVILMQLTVLGHFAPFSVVPNYMFVTVFAIVVITKDIESVVIAGIGGLLLDMFTGSPLGMNTLFCIYLAIVSVLISTSLYTTSVKVFTPICFVLSFLYEFIYGVLSMLLRSAEINIGIITKVAASVALVNSIIFIPVYLILRQVRFEKKRKGIKYEQ